MIVKSAPGSAGVNVVSKPLAVAPSKMIEPVKGRLPSMRHMSVSRLAWSKTPATSAVPRSTAVVVDPDPTNEDAVDDSVVTHVSICRRR